MTVALLRSDLADVPVFPLPKAVLFPHTQLPLRIFEPRYRAMMADCLLTEQRLMVVAQLKPGFESDYEGRPPIYDVAGLGRVTSFARNSDGTYDLVLTALSRVFVTEHATEDTPYRRGQLTPLRERTPPRGIEASELSALLSLASRVSTLLQAAQPSFVLELVPDADPGQLSDRIADQLLIDPASRQEALEILDVGLRIRFVMDRLARLHLALGGQDGSRTMH